MSPLELRTLATLAKETSQGRWLRPRNPAEGTVCAQLFRKGFVDRQVVRPGVNASYKYQSLQRVTDEARKLGLIPENS